MRIHQLDISEACADAILSGEKQFDIRFNDQEFQKGDWIRYVVKKSSVLGYKNAEEQPFVDKPYEITYVTNKLGLKEGWVVLGIEPYIKDVPSNKKKISKNIDSDIQYLLETFIDYVENAKSDDEKVELCKKYAEYMDILFKSDCPGMPMRTEEFLEDVKRGFLTDYDGIGYYVDKDRYQSETPVSFDIKAIKEMAKTYPWVLWYNK